jgi:hypothetical protein
MRNKPILFHDIDGVLCGHTAAGGEVHAMYTHRETFPLKVLKEAVDKLDFGLR